MAKKQNKGFTLIEIVIAIAILTLLLTPIVKELALSMKTNRNVKAQQHAVEDAQFVMEYFQNESLDTLGKPLDTSEGSTDNRTIYTSADVTPTTHTCDVYELLDDGSISTDPVYAALEYQTLEYELNPLEVANTSTTYTRKVVLDDLTVRLMAQPIKISDVEYSFKVVFDQKNAKDGFTLTNEGSLVKYDDTNTYVTAVVCKRQGEFDETGIHNPNEFNLGNVHSLDANQMPMINGDATNYDKQAENEFYAKAMDRLKTQIDPVSGKTAWEIELSGGVNGKSYLAGGQYLESLKKMTEINISEDDDYYYFVVNVYYENTYLTSTPDQLQYNAFSQKFAKLDDNGDPVACPDMYYEYQPFTIFAETNDSVTYAPVEYIVINNNVEGAKLYLYKPKWDSVNTYLNKSVLNAGGYDSDSIILNKSDAYYVQNEIDDMDHTANKSKVRLCIMSENSMPDNAKKNLTIYTNLNNEDVNVTNSQFVTKINETCLTGGGTINGTLNSSFKKETKTIDDEDNVTITREKRLVFDFNEKNLLGLDDEDNKEDRFFTISVVLTPENNGSASSIRLNGAKGGN